jgi:uncharacterized protein (UPF0305 family)
MPDMFKRVTRKEYIKAKTHAFITRIKEVKEHKLYDNDVWMCWKFRMPCHSGPGEREAKRQSRDWCEFCVAEQDPEMNEIQTI